MTPIHPKEARREKKGAEAWENGPHCWMIMALIEQIKRQVKKGMTT